MMSQFWLQKDYLCLMQFIQPISHALFFYTRVCILFRTLSQLFSQGDDHSPGIIPLAIKDVFSIIQDVSVYQSHIFNI